MRFNLLPGAGPSHQAPRVAKLSREGRQLLATGSNLPATALLPLGLRLGLWSRPTVTPVWPCPAAMGSMPSRRQDHYAKRNNLHGNG